MKQKTKNKFNYKENKKILILSIAFILSLAIGFYLLYSGINQQKVIEHLMKENNQLCNSFNELKEITDAVILNYVNSSFELSTNLNCSRYLFGDEIK